MLFNNFETTYSPRSIDDIVFPDTDTRELIGDLVTGDLPFPITEGKCGILLYGIPGTGKSPLPSCYPMPLSRQEVAKMPLSNTSEFNRVATAWSYFSD